MKNKIFNIYIVMAMLFFNLSIFAQGNGMEDEDGEVDENIEGEAPIENNLIILGMAGVALTWMYSKNYKKRA